MFPLLMESFILTYVNKWLNDGEEEVISAIARSLWEEMMTMSDSG
jgi:hypothetical protein